MGQMLHNNWTLFNESGLTHRCLLRWFRAIFITDTSIPIVKLCFRVSDIEAEIILKCNNTIFYCKMHTKVL